jgi:hypothetical protein
MVISRGPAAGELELAIVGIGVSVNPVGAGVAVLVVDGMRVKRGKVTGQVEVGDKAGIVPVCEAIIVKLETMVCCGVFVTRTTSTSLGAS